MVITRNDYDEDLVSFVTSGTYRPKDMVLGTTYKTELNIKE